MRIRRMLAVGALLALFGMVVVGAPVNLLRAQESPAFSEYFVNKGSFFIRTLDTMCAVLGDTTEGPSVYCFGARRVIFKLQANRGTCSTMTVQVSNNDTTWWAAVAKNLTTVLTDFASGDSLNAGGAITTLIPQDGGVTSTGGIPWRYARMFTTQRNNKLSDGNPNTTNCRSRADSLRWKIYVQTSAP